MNTVGVKLMAEDFRRWGREAVRRVRRGVRKYGVNVAGFISSDNRLIAVG